MEMDDEFVIIKKEWLHSLLVEHTPYTDDEINQLILSVQPREKISPLCIPHRPSMPLIEFAGLGRNVTVSRADVYKMISSYVSPAACKKNNKYAYLNPTLRDLRDSTNKRHILIENDAKLSILFGWGDYTRELLDKGEPPPKLTFQNLQKHKARCKLLL